MSIDTDELDERHVQCIRLQTSTTQIDFYHDFPGDEPVFYFIVDGVEYTRDKFLYGDIDLDNDLRINVKEIYDWYLAATDNWTDYSADFWEKFI